MSDPNQTYPPDVVAPPKAPAHRDALIERVIPARLKPWIRLIRADRPIGVWLLLWPCWWSVALASRGSEELPDPFLLSLFALGAFAMRSAGCIYNDILDRHLDAHVARTRDRPLASGEISVTSAAILALFMCGIGLFVLLRFNLFAVAIGFGSVGIVLIYPLMKRVTFWPQAVLGLAFSWGALMGWAAIFASLALPPLLLYAAAVFWTLGYDTIYAHQDREDDALMSIKSTARLFNEKTWIWLLGFYAATVLCLGAAGFLVGSGVWFFAGLGLGALHLLWQALTLDINDPDNCLRRFRSNQGFGAIIFAALTLDVLTVAVS